VDESRDNPVEEVKMRGNGSHERPMDRVTVPEAAGMLGIGQSAVRKRIQRGTIPWDKDEEGRVYVYVDPSETHSELGEDMSRDIPLGQSRDELLESYRDQIDFLRRELERKDTIIMSLTQRTPELEATPEPPEAPVTALEESTKDSLASQETSQKRPWWREFFGLQ
jgi:hypothetical protein